MADDVIEQVKAYIQEILRLVLDAKGRTLRELNELVGQTSKFELQSITNVHAKVIMVENYSCRDRSRRRSFSSYFC
jgi:hypothetical protein